ncbi:hypothetical protein VTN49DRAFT_7730 [Thermomyces lanuginosus]|uniref:uncharacterized protein n=1 Tax=Thermomyces lanuginosus TaxID=5541 RepID=UPI003742B695
MIDARASGGPVSALIDSLLRDNNNARGTTVIVCSTRAQFLQRLISASSISRSTEHNRHAAGAYAEQEEGEATLDPSVSSLLDTSIAVLARARDIKLAFCPTVDHLRAYLLAYNSRHAVPVQDEKRCLLVVLDAIALHQPTAEFSAQGLSRTIAMMVEVADRANSDFLLYESTDVADGSLDAERPRLPWNVQVPLLSIAARSGYRSTQQSNQEIPIRRIIQRWLHLVESEPEEAASTAI